MPRSRRRAPRASVAVAWDACARARCRPSSPRSLLRSCRPPGAAGGGLSMNPNALLRFPRALVSRARMPLRKARRRLADRASIERYLAGHRPACLHLGCGVHPLSGWLNSDLEPNDPAVIRLDATQRFPFTDAAFDYIFSEHMIEHLPAAGAGSMLAECFRTLKPGGTVRISTPDLAFLLALFDGRPSAIQQEYMEWATRTFVGSSVRPG